MHMGVRPQEIPAGRSRVYDANVVGSGIRRFALSAHARPRSGSTAGPGALSRVRHKPEREPRARRLPEEGPMRTTRTQTFGVRERFLLLAVATVTGLTACQPTAETVLVDDDDIGGVVTGPNGPEAGVWVIAETTELPTRLNRIVVTDDQGRYLIPDLPSASYDVWVRGYGLVDSEKLEASPGTVLDHTAVVAPDARAAAEYYPAGYWLSLLHVPEESEFPGTGPEGNGISPGIGNQAQFLRLLKSGDCTACHQLGTKATREIPEALGDFESSVAAWDRRIQSGQAGAGMSRGVNRLGPRGYAGDVRGLDRPHRRRRSTTRAPPAGRPGAERRHHPVGLGRPEGVPPRRGVDGSPGSHGQCERPDSRIPGAQRGLRAGSRSDEPHGEPGTAERPRSEHAAHRAEHARALAVLGR